MRACYDSTVSHVRRLAGVALALVLVGALYAPAHAAILYFNPLDSVLSDGTLGVDLDGDGSTDLQFDNTFNIIADQRELTVTGFGIAGGTSGSGTEAAALAGGTLISGATFPGPQLMAAAFNDGSLFGEFGPWKSATDLFLGATFSTPDFNTHYAWVRLDVIADGSPADPSVVMTLKDWAYESAPGTSIIAGNIPEPGTWSMLLAGLAAFGLWAGRRLHASTLQHSLLRSARTGSAPGG